MFALLSTNNVHGYQTCSSIKTLYSSTNACCSKQGDSAVDVDAFCKQALPCPSAPDSIINTTTGIRAWHTVLNSKFHFLIDNGKLMIVEFNPVTSELTTKQAYARFADKPFLNSACETVPITDEWFDVSGRQHMQGSSAMYPYALRSKVDDSWYIFEMSPSTASNPQVGVNLVEFKVASPKNDKFVSPSGVDAMVTHSWPNIAVMDSFEKGYGQGARTSQSSFPDYGDCPGCATKYCNLVRYKSGGKFGSWTAAKINPFVYAAVEGGARTTAHMNNIYRNDEGTVTQVEGIDRMQFQYVPVLITNDGNVLELRNIQDGMQYGMWPGATMNTGFYMDNGYHSEWYGNYYSYAAKFHNGEWIGGDMNGATNIDGQWGNAHRFKPAADGAMHDPNDKLLPKDPRITPFNDAKCIVNSGWGYTIVDSDGYVYHNQFATQGSLASHYNHRFDPSRSPMTAPGGSHSPTSLESGDPIAYVPPGDHLRPMVKKSAVDGTLKYVKITGETCQDIENRIAAYYADGNGVYIDDDGYAYVSGILKDRGYAIQKTLKQMYPTDIKDVFIDNAIGDVHFRGARIDLPREEYDELYDYQSNNKDDPRLTEYVRSVSPYTGEIEFTQETIIRNGGWVAEMNDVSSVPAAFETAHFLDVDITQTEEGRVLNPSVFHGLAGPNYALPLKLSRDGQETHNFVMASDINSIVPIKTETTQTTEQAYKSKAILFFMKDGTAKAWYLTKTLNLQSISLNGDSSPAPTPENPPSVAYEFRQAMRYRPVNEIQHEKFEIQCSSLPSSICQGIWQAPTTPPATFSQSTVNYLVVNVTGATSLTVRHTDFPKLKKLVLVGASMLTDFVLDKVLLSSLDMDINPNMNLHTASAGTGVSRVYINGNGIVPVEWLNSLDNGGTTTHTTEVSALLPHGTPLSKGAIRDVELGASVKMSGHLHTLALPQLVRLKVGGEVLTSVSVNLEQLFTHCPKLQRLMLPSTSISHLSSMHALGPVGAHFTKELSRFSMDEGFPNRVVEVGPISDIGTALPILSSAQAHLRYLRVTNDEVTGNVASLSVHSAHLKSLDLAGLPGVTGTLPVLPHLETLYISDSTIHVKLAELGNKIMTLHISDNPFVTGAMSDLRRSKTLYVLNMHNAQGVTGSISDLSREKGDCTICTHEYRLRFLDISSTAIGGSIETLAHHTSLGYLNAEGSKVTGDVSSLSSLDKLTYLNVAVGVVPPTDEDISNTGNWVGLYGYGTTCQSYRTTDMSYGSPDPCDTTVEQINNGWTGDGASFTPPPGFTTSSQFKDFCKLTCGVFGDRVALTGIILPTISMENACNTLQLTPALDSPPSRRLAEVKESGVHKLQEFHKQYGAVPHH